MRLAIFFVFLIASLDTVLLPASGQETVQEIIEILEKRDKLLFDQPQFSLSFRMVENEVFLPGSLVSGTIDLEIKANKVGSDWALSREFFNDNSLATNKPHYVILKNKEQFSWRSESTGATVTQKNNDVTSAQMLDYLHFAGLTPSKAIAKDSGATWNEWRVKTMKYFLVKPLIALLDNQPLLFSVEKNASQNVVLTSKTEEIELDPRRGFLVVYRKTLYEDGAPRREIIAGGAFRELIPGVWMPERFDVKQFSPKTEEEPSEYWGKLAAIDHWELGEFSLTADKSAFDVKVPPGIFISDGIRGITYRTTLNADPFDSSISKSQIVKDTRSGISFWILGSFAFVLGVTAFFLWKRWRKT